ncbi:hypothetical protein N9D01_02225 [Cyclobacteriaceae bacterium]|jgi:hypothetical protein|nr:hypothetical protein [Cyclobacteriaceae bacterium]MDA9906133.1 hypothetical protein [Cyclobacteriaceae bacterium]|tara:strand:- start:263 stop:694 length:432 start_codon:yes stop_codon:yes gene_type:complete
MIKHLAIIILLATLIGCAMDKSNTTKENIEKFMEPRILVIGRLQTTLDILVEEWERYGRNVIASNSKEKIKEIIETDSIDFIAIGGGLPDDEREEMVDYISTINSSISVHQIPRNEEAMGPYNFIPFLNNLAIMFKVRQAMEE